MLNMNIPDCPIIRSLEETGYPPWWEEDYEEEEDEEDEDNCSL